MSRERPSSRWVHHAVCCLLAVPHLARLSRLCRGRARPCSHRLPATGAVFVFFAEITVPIPSVYSYVYYYVLLVCVFFSLHAFLRRPWVLSRALGCGARKWPACTPRCKFGSRAGSVARALGVQSREIWQEITGLLCVELDPSKTWETYMAAVLSSLL